MNNGLVVVVDAPGVEAILVHEALPHREVFRQPLSTVPLAAEGSEIAGILERLGNGALGAFQGVNATGFFPVFGVSQGESQFREVARLSEILGPPVHPVTESITPRQKRAASGGTYRGGVVRS